MARKYENYEIIAIAAGAICTTDSVRRYLKTPEKMRPSTRARIERAMRDLGITGVAA